MRWSLVPVLALAAGLGGCQTVDEQPGGTLGKAVLTGINGVPAGTARLLESGSDTTVSVSLTGLPPGLHAVLLHAIGSCEPPDFTSAGPHLSPAHRQRGFENPQGAHFGDLPNALIGASGTGTVSSTLPGTPQEVAAHIFDTDGTAVVVHLSPDDNRTDPAGNSDSRIACGVILRP